MKKLANLEGVRALGKKELVTILGGGDGCRVAVRNSDGSWGYWSAAIYSYAEASSAYSSGQVYSDGSYASGYCCASCNMQ